MWISGIGTCPKNAFRASQSSTVLSLPIDHSMPRFLKLAYASRRMCTLRFSSWSRWSRSPAISARPPQPLQDRDRRTASTVRARVSSVSSGCSGGSYGSSIPVKLRISPRRARAYSPLTSRRSHSSSGVAT